MSSSSSRKSDLVAAIAYVPLANLLALAFSLELPELAPFGSIVVAFVGAVILVAILRALTPARL